MTTKGRPIAKAGCAWPDKDCECDPLFARFPELLEERHNAARLAAAFGRPVRETKCDKCGINGPDNAYRMTHATCGGIFRSFRCAPCEKNECHACDENFCICDHGAYVYD